MPNGPAVVACVVLAGPGIFQVLLATGRPWGRLAWGGGRDVLPPRLRVASVVSVVLYAGFGLVILERAGLTSLVPGDSVGDVGIWVLAVYFAVGVLLNAVSRSRPERLVMTPVAAVLAVCCFLVALSG